MELDTGKWVKKPSIIILILLSLVLPVFSSAQLSGDNYKFINLSNQYYVSDNIIIDIANNTGEDLSSVIELWLVQNEETRKFLGELKFPLTVSLDAEGEYDLVLFDKKEKRVLDSKTVIIVNKIQIISDKQYSDEFSENVTRIVNDIINSLTNSTNNNSLDNFSSYESQNDSVNEEQGVIVDCSNAVLSIDRTEIYLGEEIHANISNYEYARDEDRFEFKITRGDSTFRFMGYSREARFTPTSTGTYVASIECNGQLIQTREFNVIEEIPSFMELREKQIKIKNSIGRTDKLSIKVWSSPNEMQRKGVFRALASQDEIINSTVEIDLSGVEGLEQGRIKFNGFETGDVNSVELKVEPLNPEEQTVKGNVPVHSYAMDLSNLNFTNGTFTSIAKGNELWKCKDWNYEQQSCMGFWIKIKDLTPGREYSLEISPEDPGYAETGVATINTRKSYYMPNEEVEIFAVVLDTQGYLVSNATVQIKIILPDGDEKTKSTRDGEVAEGPKGIYSVIFSDTEIEGNYTILVSAKGQNVEHNMSSMFAVQHDYDFEVIRNTPLVTDPFKEILYSSITIVPRIPVDSYNFTEIVPMELEILSAPGATITIDENNSKTYLKWTGLSGTFVAEYTAQPPLKTPNILRLGKAYVEYFFNGVYRVFEELRDWILAIDPEVPTDDGLVVYGDRGTVGLLRYRNWTSDILQAEQSGPSTGTDNVVWVKLRCMDTRNTCIVGVTNWDGALFFSSFSTDTWTWSGSTTLTGSTYNELWSWDMDCEALSDDCIIAYENRSGTNAISNNPDFIYRVWNGTAISTETLVSVTGGENRRFAWIKLYPRKDTDTLGIVLQNDLGGDAGTPGIFGGIWNGTAFGNWQTFTTNGPSTSNGRTSYRHFDCGWEGGNGRLICTYGENGVNSVFAYRFNGTAWQSLGRIYNGTAEVLQVAVCGQEPSSNFNHSYVGMMACDTAADLDGGIWNGTAFSKSVATDTPAKNANSECGANQGVGQYGQNFQCVWENSGNQSVFVWVRNSADSFLTSGTYNVPTKTFSMANWSTGVKITASGASELRTSTLVSNPYNDKVFLVYTDAGRRGGCSLWRGNTWDGSGCNNATYFEGDGGSGARHWLGFDWFRRRLEPYIVWIRPALIQSTLTYYGVTSGGAQMAAYKGNITLLPPSSAFSPINGTEFDGGCYYDASLLDDSYCSSLFDGAVTGMRTYQSFRFYVTDPSISIDQMIIKYEGYATRTTSFTPNDYNIYIYNWNSDSYELKRTVYGGTGGDIYTESVVTGTMTDYVRNNFVYVLVEVVIPTNTTAASRRVEIMTDYISLDVESRPVLSGTWTFNVSATDKDNVSGCRWAYYNETTNLSSNTEMTSSGAYYINVTNTALQPDGNYILHAFCNDTLGNTRNGTVEVRVDNTPPAIVLLAPQNNSNFTVNYVLFSWNVTDVDYENLYCNLTIDGVVRGTNVISTHGANTSRNITSIADGTHVWNVRCIDNAGNSNISENRTFDTDIAAPVVTLNYPALGASIRTLPLDLNFTVTDGHDILNCSLYLDGVLNKTIYNVTKGVQNNFSFDSLAAGNHRWNVSCYDSFNFRGNSTQRNFSIDTGLPTITLLTPDNAVFNGTPAQFNYTVVDNYDTSLICNVTANDEVIIPNIVSQNGSVINRNISLVDGYKVWFVTCADDAGNVNVSETRTMRVIGGPLVAAYLPRNGTVNNGTNITFTYYTQDGDGLANCSLYLNDIFNQSNSSVDNFANNTFSILDLEEGVYYWNVTCYDLVGMIGYSQTFKLTSDRSSGAVNLVNPVSGLMLTTTPARFNISFTDDYSQNATCNLSIDGNVSTTNRNFILINATLTSKSETVANGFHYWNVSCFDLGGNYAFSQTWNFTVNVTFPMTVAVDADKPLYHEREIVLINVSTRNDSNRLIASNFTLDYIYTNTTYTDVPWYNLSYPFRRPVFFNETQGITRTNKPLLVNITFPYGVLTSCSEQLAVVDDITRMPVAFTVINKDDATYCYIAINGSLTANARNEQNYHVYYGNKTLIGPVYPNLTAGFTLIYDTFPSLSATTWTFNAGWDRVTNDPLPGGHAHIDGSVTNAGIRLANYFDLSVYDSVNLSFLWGVDGDWDGGEYLLYEFTNNSGTSWLPIETIAGGTGAYQANVYQTLNSSYKVSGFNMRFRATTNNANEEGGFDTFNMTAFNDLQGNTTSTVGSEHVFLQRVTNSTNSSGSILLTYDTYNKTYGNYSIPVLATTSDPKLRPGTGYDWFTIIGDNFGPIITLLYPPNGATNHSADFTFIYNATDLGNNITNCSLYVNGIFNQSDNTINETGNNTFFIEDLGEGRYYWFVNCFDTLNNSANSSTFTLYIDDTAPYIIPISPNNTVLPSGTITFTFNATDFIDSLLSCNVSVDGGNYSRTVNANNGSITPLQINNITDGEHTWNVTCLDNINNSGTSETLNFSTASLPVVKLHAPPDGYGVNSTNIVLYYNLSSSLVTNCSLILNGTYNQTANASEIIYKLNDGQNNFSFTGISYGIYTWNVICFDSNGFNSTDTTRTFHLDNSAPSLMLYYPGNGQTLYTRTINFYFNASDSVDNQLMCNLSLDGVLNKTNIPANSGANTTTQITNVGMGNHNWSVICFDNTGFNATSATWTFIIESRVAVSLVSPANHTFDADGTITFGYLPQSTSGFNLGFCDLYIDDVYRQRKAAPTADVTNYFNYTGLAEGNHTWYVNCTDNAAVVNYSTKRNILVDLTLPFVTTHYPDGDSFGSSSVFFNWTATDNMDSVLSCNIYVNGVLRTPANVASPNGSTANATYSGFSEGTFNWYAVCFDNALNNFTSTNKTFSVSAPPIVNLGNPANGSRTRNQNQTLYFTATDNSGNISSCSLIFDGELNQTRTGVSSGVQSHFNVTDIANGVHNWTVNCTDPSGNMGINLTPRTIIIDLDPPNITLFAPPDTSYIAGNNVYFNWTAADYSGTNINCSLYVDTVYNRTLTQQSGTYFTPSWLNMSDGTHIWYVICSDNLNNSVASDTWSFTINQPDLYINDSRIGFNNTNPDENARINITANVSNIGGAPVTTAIVEFWDGNPDSGGIFIGNSTGSVAFNSSRTFSVAWNITPGYHTIFVLVDPSNLIAELDETNNNATRNISILKSNITSPLNGSSFVSTQLSLDFNLTDYTNGLINYSIYVDNVYNNQSGQVNDGAINNIIVNLTQGTHTIKVQAEDALGRRKNSTALTVIIDYTAPSSNINTANASWYNHSTPQISITASDNTDNMINYTIYANGAFNTAGNISTGTTLQINLSSLPDNEYILIMEAYDDLGNIANSSPKTIYVDTTRPSIALNAPDNDANFTTRSVLLNYTPYDNLALISACNITLDGVSVNYQSGQTGQPKTYTANNLAEGTHYWNVTCRDQANNTNTSETRTFNIFIAPSITLVSPANNAWVNTANNIFYFNISDETGFENCSILLNGTINQTKTSAELTNNATNNISVTGMGGIYNWSIECYDSISYKMYNITSNRTLYVDTQNPGALIYTANDTWFNTNPVIYFNLTDNMDSVLNYTVFINGTGNRNGTSNNGQNSSVTLTGLSNDTYEIIIQATDEALNSFNSSPITIGLDTIRPTINLLYPDNDTNLTVTTVDLNFTAYDNSGRDMICNLTLDNIVVLQNVTVSNGQNINYTAYALNGGYHNWNVSCVDIARNRNTSETRRFYVLRSDIFVNESNIIFSNNEPRENETITITSLIENIGTTSAANFTVAIWEGIPGAGGRHLGNTSINLTAGESKNVSVNYITVLGTKQIWVFADRANVISEENETNNNASKYLSVGLWHYAMGTTQDRLVMEDAAYGLLFDWELDNSSNSNIFVVDSDSDINWRQLQALGLDTSNNSQFDDFAQLDVKLNSTGFVDSVNETYTSGGAAKETATFTVYSNAINNIPVCNSTDNDNFKTGIIWDYGDGGTEYNGTQDVAFLTQMKNQLLGFNSTVYDYEIRVPASLRAYRGPNFNRVDFYMEIK